MNKIPTLFNSASLNKAHAETAVRPIRNLVDLLYDGFHMLILMRNNCMPSDANTFSHAVQSLLDQFEREAQKHGFSNDNIFDAKYAFCATIDEAVLSARTGIRDAWERHPLQLLLFGEQLAGEHFFDRLEAARNGGAGRVAALEVFQMCLLIGFKGRYLLEGPEKLKYLISQLSDQIIHLKGPPPGFAPHWSTPDNIANAIARDIPLWIIASALALLGLLAYIGLQWHGQRTAHNMLAPYSDIVQLPPHPPTLTITLP